MIRRGRKSAAQTPAPKKERVYGSSKNPVGSAASKTSASKIQLSESIVNTLEDKRNDFNDNHPKNKVSLATLKAVMRRGMGAYSKSHRPTITGGAPNSRQAWGFARVNKFLKKYAGQKVKAAYVQDDDLMDKGGELYHLGGDIGGVLSENGNPITFYHGTTDKGYGSYKYLYFTADKEYATLYAEGRGRIIEVNLKINNPFVIQAEYMGQGEIVLDNEIIGYYRSLQPDAVEKLKNAGYDGIVVHYPFKNKKYFEVIPFDKSQIIGETFAEGGLIAPNGKPSNLTHEQYKLVRTPQFKAWFGDWENDPKNASKVVDENGEPLVVYHGSKKNFTEFRKDKLIWVTPDKDYITEMKRLVGENTFELFANSRKVIDLSSYGYKYYDQQTAYEVLKNYGIEIQDILIRRVGAIFYAYIQEFQEEIKSQLKVLGYDGIKLKVHRNFDYAYAFFDSNQVKLADGTNTTFDANNLDIRYEDGGLTKSLGMAMGNLKKNGIVLKDKNETITLIAYNTGNQERKPSLYNKSLIYSSVKPIKSANEIIQNFDFQDFENFSEDKLQDYRKSHLIIMNQNEVVYDSNVYAEGGDMGQEITCVNCGWHWNTNQSDEYDKYVCHKCGFDNRTFYDSDPIGMMKKKIYNTNYKYGGMNKIQLPDTESSYDNLQPILAKQGYMLNRIMKPTKSVEEIADEFDVTKAFVEKQLRIGSEHEMEHTYSKEVARDTALHHLAEDPEYYIRLKDMEMRTEAEKLQGFYEKGGAFSTETTCEVLDKDGERQIDKESIDNLTACLNDLPQTKSMHFDYEKNEYTPARKRLHRDIIYEFKKDLICIDREEPIAILMGGSPASGKSTFLKKYAPYLLKEEIFKVDADEIRSKLPEYRGYNATQTHLETKDIVTTLLSDRNIGIPCRFDLIYDGTMNNTKSYIPLINLLKKDGYKVFIVYIDRVPKDVIVKRALERYKKSGRFVPLEVIDDFFEKGKTALQQLKEEVDGYMIVDGSNSDYKVIERGGEQIPQDRNYSKIGEPIKITTEDVVRELKKGGEIDADDPQIKQAMTHKAGAAGGLLVGNRHSEGGIKAVNKSTNQPLEMEGGEVVITRDAVSDETKREFEGEMLSNREILSRINESGGGVSFAKGGDVPSKCACMGKQYKFGGKMMRDNDIVNNIMTSHRKLFGIKYPELKPSEAMSKIFGNTLKFEAGGEIYGEGGTLVLVNKKIPTFNAFSRLNKNINPQAMKRYYKSYLRKEYFVNFDELPHMIQAALLMGNQKLVDSYINS